MSKLERILAAWCEIDQARALHPADRELIDATRAARALVLERVESGSERDLYNACAVLGRLIGARGGSPTLAVATIDGAVAALGAPAAEWATPARAAVAEGYAAALAERLQTESRSRWEYPRCVVRVDETTVAIAAGYPEEDGEALASWADRVARECSRAGVRRAIVAGAEQASSAIAEALAAIGIDLVSGASREPPPRGLWPPWRRRGGG